MRQPMPLSCCHSTIIRPASSLLWNASCIGSQVWFLTSQPVYPVSCGWTSYHRRYKWKFASSRIPPRTSLWLLEISLQRYSSPHWLSYRLPQLSSGLCLLVSPKNSKSSYYLSPFIVSFIILQITKPSTSLLVGPVWLLSAFPLLCSAKCTYRSNPIHHHHNFLLDISFHWSWSTNL